jgi:hypothetical protein
MPATAFLYLPRTDPLFQSIRIGILLNGNYFRSVTDVGQDNTKLKEN